MNQNNSKKIADMVADNIKSQIDPNDTVSLDITNKKIKKLRKAANEVERLRNHAGMCLIDGNREGFIYSIRKIKGIIGISYTENELNLIYDNSIRDLKAILAKG